jgi:hypothetical protein
LIEICKSVEEIRDVGGAKSIVGRSWKSLSGRIVVSSFREVDEVGILEAEIIVSGLTVVRPGDD